MYNIILVSHENGKADRNVSERIKSRVLVGRSLFEIFRIGNGVKQTEDLSALFL
jgi:hypothetical protein